MEKYKAVLKKRIALFCGSILAAAALLLANFFHVFGYTRNSSFGDGVFAGFQTGLLCAMMVLFIVMIIRYVWMMREDQTLKKAYFEENDERKKLIKQKCGGNVMLFSSVMIIFAGVIAGYYNETVFYSLIACALFQLYLSVFLKLYYSRKL